MKKVILVLSLIMLHVSFGAAQTAKEVLDKCAATLTAKEGLRADFTMQSAQYGSASGTIAVKGRMFHATTSVAAMWFDGKTQWTYMKKNDEVNVTTPSESELQAFNPYNFINMYKKGYKYSMTTADKSYKVHLTATGSKKISEMFITVDKSSYQPSEVKMLQGKKWTTFTISNLKKVAMADAEFRFNSKDYPTAEVIDLR
ncbi:MAG: cell envelope biogenesis protein LolA [Prevotella sp.]|nr:cell envelope biogenesis protein LolA [Prevotella sp.]